jgi:hypothetical protein
MSETQENPLTETPLVVKLPIWAWNVIMQHLNRGTFGDVAQVIFAITGQAHPQLVAAQVSAAQTIPTASENAATTAVRTH